MREPSIVDARGVARSLPALIAAADGLAAELPPARSGSLVAFAFENDHAAFAVALWASWLRGHTVALPQDARRLAVGATMQLPEVVAFLHDTGAGNNIGMRDRQWPAAGAESVHDDIPAGTILHCVPLRDGRLTRTPITVAELRQQVAAAAAAMPLPDGATLVVTYAAGHLPALAPGLLLPLQRGATIVSANALPPAALSQGFVRTGATDLLASPDVLRGLARLPVGAFHRVARVYTLQAVDRATTVRLQREHRVAVHELVARDAVCAPTQALVDALLAMPGVDDAEVVQTPFAGGVRNFALLAAAPGALAAVRSAASVIQAVLGGPAARFLVTERLPRDRNGGVAAAAVLFAFGLRVDGSPPNRDLAWSEARCVGGEWQARVAVPADFAGFDGHFIGFPVLSGSVQLHDIVQPALARALAAPVAVDEYSDLKFLARIGPGDILDVAVELAPDRGGAVFVLTRGGTRCTTGRASWRANEASR